MSKEKTLSNLPTPSVEGLSLYLAQIKKDHMEIQQWTYSKVPTVSINATKVQFEIEKLKKEWHI